MHPQGVDCLTFSPGPLDGSLTIPQLLDRHLEHSPNHTTYIYDDPKGGIISVTFSQYIRTVHAACGRILRDTHSLRGPGTAIGIFAITDTISYCLLVAAIQRSGMVPFCISPRSAPEGLANMLTQTSAAAVYVSPDSRSKSVLSEALAIGGAQVPVFDAPTFEQLQCDLDASFEPLPPLPRAALDGTALILHTSGRLHSSPPSFYFSILEADMSHKILLQYASVPWSSTEDNCGRILGGQNLPNFHGIGIFLGTWPISTGLIIAVFRPTTPPILPTPENALHALIATKPDLVLSTPASIEAWSDDPLGLKMMQSIKCLSYIGAPLNKRLGDALVSKGVVLCSSYGAMEIGLMTAFFRCHGKNWDYFAVEKQMERLFLAREVSFPG
ncbi:hypothetical protein C8R44DRAFT_989685 [Mycena epipterygia]|nr:hypothetical protein C8R44DRAFT_989685 [Mycena epipterygia]